MYLRGYCLRIDWPQFIETTSNKKISTALLKLGGSSKLFVHSQGDKQSPYQVAREFYQKAPEPKELLLVKGCAEDG